MSSSEDESFKKETVATSSKANLAALKALQVYETGRASPNQFSESTVAFKDVSFFRPFKELNYFKSVEEEDTFLYQDSIPLHLFLPKEPQCAAEFSGKMEGEKQIEWSDDEYDEPLSMSQIKLNYSKDSPVHNQISNKVETKSQQVQTLTNKKLSSCKVQESKSFPQSQQEQEVNSANVKLCSILKKTIPIEKGKVQKLHSSMQSSSVSSKDFKKESKSKFHIATQILDINDSGNKYYPNVENEISQTSLYNKNAEISEKEKLMKLATDLPSSKSTKPLEHTKEHQPKHIYPKRQPGKDYGRYKSEVSGHLSPTRNFPHYHSRHQSTYNKKYKSLNKDLKYESSSYYSKHRSTEMEYERGSNHYSFNGHRQYSRSPTPRSRKKSPEHFRYKDSPKLYRSQKRSRSPSYESHEYKYKKYSRKFSDRSLDHYYPKRHRKSQDSSFSSSSSNSNSGSSSDSSTSSKKSAKSISEELPKNKVNNDESKSVANVESEECFNAIPAKSYNASFLSEHTSKSTLEINKSINEEDISSILNLLQRSIAFSEFYQDLQQQNSLLMSFTKPVENITGNGQAMSFSSSQMPITMSNSPSYPVTSLVTIPYCPPAVSDSLSVIPPLVSTLHPVIPASPVYDPYTDLLPPIKPFITVENNVDRLTNKIRKPRRFEMKFKKRPSALRRIELDPGSRISRSIESSELKENVSVSPILNTIKVNSEPSNAVEEYNKIKYEMHSAECSKRNSKVDWIEMSRLMQEVWKKFQNASENSEPNIHSQCVKIFDECTTFLKQCSDKLKHVKEELDELKAQQSLENQQKLARIETECYFHILPAYVIKEDFKNLLEYSALMEQRRKEIKYKLATEKRNKDFAPKQSKKQKTVYIGKAPCFKKENIKLLDKRENLLNKNNSESGISMSQHAINVKKGKIVNPVIKMVLSGSAHQDVCLSETISKNDILQIPSISSHPTLQSGCDNTFVPVDVNNSPHSNSNNNLASEKDEYCSVLASKRDLLKPITPSSNAGEVTTSEALVDVLSSLEKLISEWNYGADSQGNS